MASKRTMFLYELAKLSQKYNVAITSRLILDESDPVLAETDLQYKQYKDGYARIYSRNLKRRLDRETYLEIPLFGDIFDAKPGPLKLLKKSL